MVVLSAWYPYVSIKTMCDLKNKGTNLSQLAAVDFSKISNTCSGTNCGVKSVFSAVSIQLLGGSQ